MRFPNRNSGPKLWHWLLLLVLTCVLMFVSLLNYITIRSALSCRDGNCFLTGDAQTARLRAAIGSDPNTFTQVGNGVNDIGAGLDGSEAGVLNDPAIARRAALLLTVEERRGEGNAVANPLDPNSKVTREQFEKLMSVVYQKAPVGIAPSAASSRMPAPSPASTRMPRAPSMSANPTVVPLQKRRIILTISTGHTGTMWLVRALRCTLHPILAEHEPKPSLVAFHKVLLFGKEDTFELRKTEKWGTFLRMLNNATAAPGAIYAEISHMFIKAWADLFTQWLAEEDPDGSKFDVDIVVLRRYLPYVMRSFLTDKQTWNPAMDLKTWSGGEYTIHHTNFAILPALLPHGTEDSVDMLLGYLVDMELQYIKFRAANPQFRYIEFRAEELFTVDGTMRLHKLLGLEPLSQRCLAVLKTARPVNQHVSWKGPQMLNITTDVFIARYYMYKLRYETAGLPFPEMPHSREVAPCESGQVPDPWCEQPEPIFTIEDLQKVIVANPIPNNAPPVRNFTLPSVGHTV